MDEIVDCEGRCRVYNRGGYGILRHVGECRAITVSRCMGV